MPSHDPDSPEAPWFFAGPGVSNTLARQVAWERTALGPCSGWSTSLKATLAMVFHARQPMFVWWGPELIQFYNDAYLPSFGRGKHPTAMGQRGRDCWQEIWPIIWPQIDDVMARGKASWHEDALVPIERNGRIEEVYWTYSYCPVFDDDGSIGGTLVICTETTDQVVARQTLERTSAEREKLVAALAAANRTKDEFLAMLGHELRNPLAPIVTALQVMKLQSHGEPSREHRVIERQVTHLVRLVDDLLDVARITRGQIDLHREHVDIADLFGKAIEMASHLLEKRGHRLAIDLPGQHLLADGDPIRLAQIVANLLTNAARYTEPGGHIRLRARQVADTIEIRVQDDGIGIPADMLPRMFDLFVQGQRNTDRVEGGLGIGLALVKNLVALHGGSVTAHSDGPGQGSEFILSLPAITATTTTGPGPALTPSVPPPADARVLIVDDNVDAAEILGDMLTMVGYEVALAHDALAALELLPRFRPHVAILDIGLPVIDGHELAARIRADPRNHATRLIALSGYGQSRDQDRSHAADFERHLIKPVDIDELIALLQRPA